MWRMAETAVDLVEQVFPACRGVGVISPEALERLQANHDSAKLAAPDPCSADVLEEARPRFPMERPAR
jgi:hypothetical protein